MSTLSPKDRVALLNKRQDEAIKSWWDKDKRGFVMSATGTGKSFILCKSIKKCYEEGELNRGDTIQVFSETNVREGTFMKDEFPKFAKIYDFNVPELFNIEFLTYQSKKEPTAKFVGLDEADKGTTEKYFNVFKFPYMGLALSATDAAYVNLFKNDIEDNLKNKVRQSDTATKKGLITTFVNKAQIMEMFCPVVYRYSMNQAINEGTLSPFEVIVLEHRLDNRERNIKIWKTKDLHGTEQYYYERRKFLSQLKGKSFYYKQRLGKENAKLLHTLPSKIPVAKQIVKNVLSNPNNKLAVYAPNLDYLGKIIGDENVARENTEQQLDEWREGERRLIGSSKKLTRGITLDKLNRLLLVSYYSNSYDIEQILGRLVRYEYGKVGKAYIFVTVSTYEQERWFDNMQIIKNYDNKEIDRLPFNIKKYIDTRTLL